jgi:amino acid transporter
MMSKPRGAPFASWVTGWFNLLGQVAVTTGIRYVIVSLVGCISPTDIYLFSQLRMRQLYLYCGYYWYELPPELAQDDRDLCRGSYRPRHSAIVYSLEISTKLDSGTINTFGVRILKYLNNVSVWWHALGTISIVIAVLAGAPKHQSGKFVFRTFIDGTGVDGVGWSQRASPAYVAVIGILTAQYTLLGWVHTSLKDVRFLNRFFRI